MEHFLDIKAFALVKDWMTSTAYSCGRAIAAYPKDLSKQDAISSFHFFFGRGYEAFSQILIFAGCHLRSFLLELTKSALEPLEAEVWRL